MIPITIITIIWIASFTFFYVRSRKKQVSCESVTGENRIDKRIALIDIGFMVFIYILSWILVTWAYV